MSLKIWDHPTGTAALKSAKFSITLGKLAKDFNSIAYPRGGE
jgi:hypothetical protein